MKTSLPPALLPRIYGEVGGSGEPGHIGRVGRIDGNAGADFVPRAAEVGRETESRPGWINLGHESIGIPAGKAPNERRDAGNIVGKCCSGDVRRSSGIDGDGISAIVAGTSEIGNKRECRR